MCCRTAWRLKVMMMTMLMLFPMRTSLMMTCVSQTRANLSVCSPPYHCWSILVHLLIDPTNETPLNAFWLWTLFSCVHLGQFLWSQHSWDVLLLNITLGKALSKCCCSFVIRFWAAYKCCTLLTMPNGGECGAHQVHSVIHLLKCKIPTTSCLLSYCCQHPRPEPS